MLSLLSCSKPDRDTNSLACLHPAIISLFSAKQTRPGHQCLACFRLGSHTGTLLPSLLESGKPGRDTNS